MDRIRTGLTQLPLLLALLLAGLLAAPAAAQFDPVRLDPVALQGPADERLAPVSFTLPGFEAAAEDAEADTGGDPDLQDSSAAGGPGHDTGRVVSAQSDPPEQHPARSRRGRPQQARAPPAA